MFSASLLHNRMRYRRIAIIYTLLSAIVLSLGAPIQVMGAGAAFMDFSVVPETTALYSGYSTGGTYTKETPAYHFEMTSAEALQAGDKIEIMLPHGFNFVGNPNSYGLWTTDVSVPSNSVEVKVNGSTLSLFDSVTTQRSDNWQPMISFQLNQPIPAGGIVDIKLANFLITPDYHYVEPKASEFAVSTSSNSVLWTALSHIYFRSVVNFRPDMSTYAAAANTSYQFKFTVMQQITPTDWITLKFPASITLPAAIDTSKVQIDGIPVTMANVVGDKLQLQPSQPLTSYSDALITIDTSALIANPAVPGYYTFELSTSVDQQPAPGRVGIIPTGGASLADNPYSDKGYVEINYDGKLRFRFTSPTILKGGDTVTVSSPAGTVLSDTAIAATDIHIESGMGLEMDGYSPTSVIRLADNQLQFVLPPEYYLIPDYSLVFSMPNHFVQYGVYEMQVTTSQTVKPNTVPLTITPDKVQEFTVIPDNPWAGETNVPYTFSLQPNEPLIAADDDYITLNLPPQLKVPVVLDPSTNSGTIDPNLVLVNGVPAKEAIYISNYGNSILRVTVPQNIPLLGRTEIAISGNAGWMNPEEGTYAFSVYPNYFSSSLTSVSVEYKKITGISAAPQTVQLKLGGNVSQQLKVIAQQLNNSVIDVTDAVYRTKYSSSDNTVATVTADGLIEAKQSGTSTITVTSGLYSDTVSVTVASADVTPPANEITGITASPRSVQLQMGVKVSQQLTVTAQQSNNIVKDVTDAVDGTTYRSSDSTMAFVTTDGLIEAKQAGSAVITVTNFGFSDTVNVTINPINSGPPTTPSPPTGTTGAAEEPLSVEKEIIALLGGEVTLPSVGSVIIPPEALMVDSKIKVAAQANPSPNMTDRTNISRVVNFTSSTGTNLNKPIQISLQYDGSTIAPGLKPAVYVFNRTIGKWLYVGGAVTGNGTVAVEVNFWGTFAVFSAEQHVFTDMNGHWAVKYVDRLAGRNVVHGFEDHTFRPDQPVTRAQLVKMLADALALKVSGTPTNFADSHLLQDWAKDAVSQSAQEGLIKGYEEKGKSWFKPNQPLTRAELAVILARVLERNVIHASKEVVAFTDQKDIPEWAQSAVIAVSGANIVSGYPDGSFRQGGFVTRAEAAKMIYMLLESLHN
ncbi:S-layer homology domain-containing protein [Paenibacillus sp. NRS-1760]|uniref:S-layer homology domain-containing protein n=1 Tax=Paenibacillus sp. NRS-1760 TaxID=3233902 RepID=UPI003D28494F